MFIYRDQLRAYARMVRDSEVLKTFMKDLSAQVNLWVSEHGLDSKHQGLDGTPPVFMADADRAIGSQFGIQMVVDPLMPEAFFLRYDVEADFREHGVLLTLKIGLRDSRDAGEVSSIPRLVLAYEGLTLETMLDGIVTRLREVFEVSENPTQLGPGLVRKTLDMHLSNYTCKCIP